MNDVDAPIPRELPDAPAAVHERLRSRLLLVRSVIKDVEVHHEEPKGPGLFQRQARQVILFFSRR